MEGFFQLTPIPLDAMKGTYNLYLVALSYLMACLASWIALDITERIRASSVESPVSRTWWLILGALAMGCGIWTMHFIGMLAFVMPMTMQYDPLVTLLSMIIAVVASWFAFYLIKNETVRPVPLVLGGVLLGFGICSMHYVGMAAMDDVHIHYLPGLFALSVLIAVVTSETALYLMIMGSRSYKYKQLLKLGSSLIMGLAICGMHYTGMFAAVFTMSGVSQLNYESPLTPDILSFVIAAATILIMSIALVASKYWVSVLRKKNQQLLEAEAILQQKSLELSKMVEASVAREERIRAILTAAGDGIIVTDERGVIELCNRAAENIFNDSAQGIISQNITKFFGMPGNGDKRIHPIDFDFLVQKKSATFELVGIGRQQSIKPVEVTISQSLLNKVSYIIVFRDIGERKRAEEQLALLNQQLVSTARLAGMAEVATSVLHNVGNVLNSINVSSRLLLERDSKSKIDGLVKVAELVESQRGSLETFLRDHPIGRRLPEYLQQFALFWDHEWAFMRKELESLNHKVQHIKNIVRMQQALSGRSKVIEKVEVDKLLEDAVAINSEILEKCGIRIVRDYQPFPVIETDRVKAVQILVNLVKNAVEALAEGCAEDKILTLRIQAGKAGYVHIEVSDNGKGIKPEEIRQIFSYGFTTKEHGHGFGLHSSSLGAQDVGGSLRAYSEGVNKGATFVLEWPVAPQTSDHLQTVGIV